jgi:hypothetical protein
VLPPFPLLPLLPLVVLPGCDIAAAAPVAAAVAAAAARMCVLPLVGPLGTDGVMGKGGGIVQVSGGGVEAMHSQT